MRAAVLALALLLGWAASAGGASDDVQLLGQHAPVLLLHPEETLVPVAVDGFVADSDLVRRSAAGTWAPAGVELAEAVPTDRLDQRLCKAIDGPAALSCYAAAEASHRSVPTTYGAVFRRPGRIALQYWLFYPVNVYRPPTAVGEFWQAHEGDWEAVTILLGPDGRPATVGLSRHCGGITRSWRAAPKRGSHLIAYVALGSHAMGFVPGAARLDERCWPKEALAVYRAYGVTLRDLYAAGRTVSPRVIRVTANSPSWMHFPGGWGEDQWVRFPDVEPLRFGQGPVGPAFHKLWRQPFATPLGWARGKTG
jgi:hypothetical protein